MMLLKQNRLKKKKDFERVFKEGKGFKEKFLALRMTENNKEESRIGFVVQKKYFKKAVLRNKIKRQLREQVRKRMAEIKRGYDVVILARAGLEKAGFGEMDKTLEKLLLKAKLLRFGSATSEKYR